MSLTMSLSSSISSSTHDDSMGSNSFKINALYYKKHTRTAVGIRGKLILDQSTLSFRSKKGNKELNYTWNLSSICVERFKGRIHGGIKICEQKQGTIDVDDDDEQQQPTEYIFTMVNQRSYDMLDEATSMARFDASMKKVRRSSIQQIAQNGISLSKSLSVVDDDVVDTAVVKRPPLLLRPLRFLFMIIVRLFSLFYMSCTGRRFWSPRNMHDALHGILTRVSTILSVSKTTLSSDIRVRSIEKDVNRIYQSLRSIQTIYHKQSPAFQSSGHVVEGNESSFYQKRFISPALILSKISYIIFCLRKTLNIPQYRWQLMEPYQSPSTVSQAVKNANEKVLGLIYLVKHQELAPEALSKIIVEAEQIQLILFNIKVNSTGEIIMPDSSSSKEE